MKQNYYLGIDVSKGYSDFIMLNDHKREVEKSFQLDDNLEGHNQLHRFLSDFIKKHPDCQIYAAVESTGGYENNWFAFLSKCMAILPLFVARLNPFGVNYNSKASLKRITTDKESARNIAEYMISHPEKIIYNREDYFSSARRLWTFIKMLTKQKVQLINQLHSMLYIANPELLKYCNNKMNNWFLLLLQKYPTARLLAKAKMAAIAKIPFITEVFAQELIESAKISVASSNDDTSAEVVKALAEQILYLKKMIKIQTQLLEKTCNLPEVEILKSFKGIATYSAVGLVIEIVSVERFASAKKLGSYFGVNPVFKQSGDGLSGFKMSKRGRKQPRQLLFNVARVAISKNPHFKEIYAQHLQKGMPKMAAMGAIMYKILRIVYGMLKYNKPYDPEIDRRNREKHISNNNIARPDGKRRFQKLALNAPISRRQIKKRKEQEKSHSVKPLKMESHEEIFSGSDSDSFPNVAKEI